MRCPRGIHTERLFLLILRRCYCGFVNQISQHQIDLQKRFLIATITLQTLVITLVILGVVRMIQKQTKKRTTRTVEVVCLTLKFSTFDLFRTFVAFFFRLTFHSSRILNSVQLSSYSICILKRVSLCCVCFRWNNVLMIS